MSEPRTLAEFFSSYDFLDRGVDAVSEDNNEVTFVFSLMHVDDPARNDETKEYLLKAVFRADDVATTQGTLPFGAQGVGGEILDFELLPDQARIGISWIEYATGLEDWTDVLFRSGPVACEETVIDAAS